MLVCVIDACVFMCFGTGTQRILPYIRYPLRKLANEWEWKREVETERGRLAPRTICQNIVALQHLYRLQVLPSTLDLALILFSWSPDRMPAECLHAFFSNGHTSPLLCVTSPNSFTCLCLGGTLDREPPWKRFSSHVRTKSAHLLVTWPLLT